MASAIYFSPFTRTLEAPRVGEQRRTTPLATRIRKIASDKLVFRATEEMTDAQLDPVI